MLCFEFRPSAFVLDSSFEFRPSNLARTLICFTIRSHLKELYVASLDHRRIFNRTAGIGAVIDRQGDSFKGDVTEDPKFVYIDGAGGQIKLDKRNIASITYAGAVDAEYKTRHAKLADNDVKGRIDLAAWANTNGRADLAVAALTEARKIDPFNKDAARALDAAQQQLELDQAAAHPKTATATTAPTTASTTASASTTTAPTTQTTDSDQGLTPRRLLTADEINTIRQKEMQSDEDTLKIRFDHNVIRTYLKANPDVDADAFNKSTDMTKANEIITKGTPELAREVKILTDPRSMLEYKSRVNPIFLQSCGTNGCHGGNKGGDFGLFPGESTPAVYTNFYIIFKYSKTIDGIRYLGMDREVPERSLLLQFGLPHADAKPPHPKVTGWKPRFKSVNDPSYQIAFGWLTKSLSVLQPDYGIHMSARLVVPAPTTAPAPVK